jgi:hypothetical protein
LDLTIPILQIEEQIMSGDESVLRGNWPGDFERDQELGKKLLREELGASEIKITDEWKPAWGQNRPLVELTLTDLFTRSQVSETFAPDEFLDEAHLGDRIHRLWGRLLQARTDGQIKRLRELISQEQGVG